MGFRNASTNVPATASTPGSDPLTSLFRLAKDKMQRIQPPGNSSRSGWNHRFRRPEPHAAAADLRKPPRYGRYRGPRPGRDFPAYAPPLGGPPPLWERRTRHPPRPPHGETLQD